MPSKEELEKLSKINGEARGMAVRSGLEYTLYKKGEEGLRKLEAELERFGFPIKNKDIKSLNFYPLAWEGIIFVVAKELFNYTDEDFQELGERESKLPLIVRLFMKHLGSIKMIAREGPRIWKDYYTVGSFEVSDFNEKKKYAVIRIKNFRVHPLHCQNIAGYLKGVVRVVGKDNATCKETKCIHKGDDYHEYLVEW